MDLSITGDLAMGIGQLRQMANHIPGSRGGGCGKAVVIGVSVLAAIWLLGGIAERSEDAEIGKRLATATAERLTVAQVLDAFAQNELAAQDRFLGRVVEVTGTVGQVTDGFDGAPLVMLGEASGGREMLASLMPDERTSAAGLAKGQDITLRCARISAKLTAPTLLDCRLPVPANQYP